MAFRQINAGLNIKSVKSNIEDQYVDSACASFIIDTAYQKQLEEEAKSSKKDYVKELSSKDVIIPILLGLRGAIIGGILWAGIAIITKSEFLFLDIFIGLLAGHGTYKLVNKRNLLIYRIISVLTSFIGIVIGNLLFFIFFNIKNQIQSSGIELLVKSASDFIYSFNIANLIWILVAMVVAAIAVPRNYLNIRRIS